MNIVVLAGGSGTRLWPKSRHTRPKQFARIVNEKTMIENTVDRLLEEFDFENIYFSTVPEFSSVIKEIFPNVAEDHIIVEPEKRDNAAAYAFVAAHFMIKDPDEPLAFIPSDHYIRNVEKFNRTLRVAEGHIRETGKMLDIAIEPTFPSTALGYTKVGDKLDEIDDIELYSFVGHTEKPAYEVAQQYVREGSYLWHGSYYMWTARGFLEAYEKYAPDIYVHVADILKALTDGKHDEIVDAYGKIEKTSIDFAITEKMNHDDVRILKGDFGWSDIGTWDVLYDLKKVDFDQNQNYIQGNWVGIDTSGSYISSLNGKLVATVGIDDLVIVDTKDALLICPKSRAQDVKRIVQELKDKNKKNYL